MILNKNLTVCYFGTYRAEYSRNRIMLKGLLKNQINVIECHETLWKDIDDRVNAVKFGLINPKLWGRVIGTYIRLIKKFITLPKIDVLIVGYPGQFDVFVAKFLTFFKKTPIIWDVFMSIYLISIERNLHKKNPISVKFLKFIEHLALRIPNKLIIDTEQYAHWFQKTYRIPRKKFCLVPTGADDDVFYQNQYVEYQPKEKFIVLYYGTYIPNHGVPYIIEAAKLLKNNPSIIFQFIGSGPELDMCKKTIIEYGLSNVQIFPWMDQEKLKEFIYNADVVLGAFGKTPQSLMTIQNKIYEGMAMGKVVITGNSDAVKSQFTNYSEIIICDRDDPESLENIINDLYNNPQIIKSISGNSLSRFNNEFSVSKNGFRFLTCINYALNRT